MFPACLYSQPLISSDSNPIYIYRSRTGLSYPYYIYSTAGNLFLPSNYTVFIAGGPYLCTPAEFRREPYGQHNHLPLHLAGGPRKHGLENFYHTKTYILLTPDCILYTTILHEGRRSLSASVFTRITEIID